MRTAEIREKYLKFFESKGHLALPSFSLIPEDDPTLLFTVAGMAPLKPYFLGARPVFPGHEGEHRRVVTCQKCLRVGDIENVGRTARHNTFFEMLGNFSFGDYFKREAILWAWEFLTSPEWLGLDPDRLYVTVFEDDDEAYRIWRDEVGVPEERIGRFGEDENFWPANAISQGPNGPCGPCSEIFYDRGPGFGSADETGPNTGSGDRFVEVWNLVFTQYNRTGPVPGPGQLEPLPQRNIDTGMGLYRVAAILQDVQDFYDTDTFRPIIDRVVELSGRPYEGAASVSHRVIADHVRAVVAALSDGAVFSNTGRGYVIRRLLRRAVRHGYLLGLREPFMYRLAPVVAEVLGDYYPEMRDNLPATEKAIRLEEERFLTTLESGIRRLEDLLQGIPQGGVLSGEEAFRLYDTYGFPWDLTVEIAAERGVRVDREGFERAMARQQERARKASAFTGEVFVKSAEALDTLVAARGATEFTGYTTLEDEGEVLLILEGEAELERAEAGREVQVVLDRTPFYAEGGGQIGDFGYLEWAGGRARVVTTRKSPQGIHLHQVRVEEGVLEPGRRVRAVVDPARRATERNHTATHLLHAALRAVLGPHVRQAGSLVAPDRLRFDFTHPEPLSLEELERIERLVNRWVQADFPVTWTYKPLEEAKREGAMALFGEKYADVVRVVSVEGSPDVRGILDAPVTSKELCGGCHVRRTGEIGYFVIRSEEALAAGVRRIEALTGEAAVAFARGLLNRTQALARELGTTVEAVPERVQKLQEELKARGREIERLKAELARAQLGTGGKAEAREAGGWRYLAAELSGLDMNALRRAADELLEARGVDLVAVGADGMLVVKVSPAAQERGLAAGRVMKALAEAAGGRGGGREALAQGGGFDLKRAFAALEEVLRSQS
ncbi:alanine--tRNA ligase [Marinithermus hydrothermalis]|uniref:Alanine--tRNA ligase n=1 Tax=Marinithermus hydrothermalis (strain DSM 14884 / JCM 11576 / T1) TaxID=869210 RepID=F2NQ39_MARHT|nr:alanine--tRNA ligase [Marinithermus hydrothermalis]AEB11350.1 alanyl-tRNA synthetase [Marinithermus hydrothermalis DSM 14884]